MKKKTQPIVENPCSVCCFPIFGSYIGTGDGTMKNGGSFAHPECYWRDQAGKAAAQNKVLRDALRGLLDAEWMVSHDWGGDRDAIMAKAKRALRRAPNTKARDG